MCVATVYLPRIVGVSDLLAELRGKKLLVTAGLDTLFQHYSALSCFRHYIDLQNITHLIDVSKTAI